MQNDGSHVRAVLLPEGRLAIDRITGTNVTSLTSVPLTNMDTRAWHALSLKMLGDKIEVFVDGNAVASATDPQPLPQGNAGVFVDGAAQVDTVMWRKAAVQEPAVTLGPRETPADAKNGWLSFAPSPTPAPAPQPAPTPMPIARSADAAGSPLMLVMAVASLIVAGGILLMGFVRRR
jgi:hypothetical protein